MPAVFWVRDRVLARDVDTFFYYMLEEGYLKHNGKLFDKNPG